MNFHYEIKKSKGKNIRISINRYAQVFLHVPKYYPEFLAKKFLQSKSDWVEKNLEKMNKRIAVGGAAGEARRPDKRTVRKEYLQKKEEARILVHEKLQFWQKYYLENFSIKFVWNKVAIKNTKTRLGSCSSKKNLNFSYEILTFSQSAQDYLIIHELSHLLQMNHSKNFWHLVSLGCPNHKQIRKSLKSSFVE